ncbi:hypothetical protein SLA2020_432080 [Shorea laevis]
MAQAPRVITEKENAPAKRDCESKGTKSEFRWKRESGNRTAEIQRRVGDLSINSGIERVKVRAEEDEEREGGDGRYGTGAARDHREGECSGEKGR